MSDGSGQRVTFSTPDGLRGWAALWVTLFHVEVSGKVDAALDQVPAPVRSLVVSRGALGVSVFFVLSGFVMSHSLRRNFERPVDGRAFAARRVLRITPPYYAAIVVAVAFAVLASRVEGRPFSVGGTGGEAPLTLGRALAHLLYLQEILGFENINDVFWTLSLEMQFYALFALLVWVVWWVASRTTVGTAMAAVVGPVAVVSLLWPLGLVVHDGRAHVFWPLWFLFLLGALTYWTWQRRMPPIALLGYFTALAVGIATGPYAAVTISGLVTAAILLAASGWGRLDRWLADPVSQFLGRISYSLYLVHTPVLGATLAILMTGDRASSAGWAWLGLAVGLATSILAATAFHLVVERPSMRWARAVGRRDAERSTASSVGGALAATRSSDGTASGGPPGVGQLLLPVRDAPGAGLAADPRRQATEHGGWAS